MTMVIGIAILTFILYSSERTSGFVLLPSSFGSGTSSSCRTSARSKNLQSATSATVASAEVKRVTKAPIFDEGTCNVVDGEPDK
jgi:hypothetical protein